MSIQPSEDTIMQASPQEKRSERKLCSRRHRFDAALLVLVSLGLLQLSLSRFPSVLIGPLAVLLALFIHEFSLVHGPAMTRHKRAYFDVTNVLETYQPRARTMGHLFEPEPPTPGVSFSDKSDTHDAENANSEFKNARDSHYANMYEHAMKMAKEMEALEKGAGSSALDAAQDSTQLVPADPTTDKKKYDEKKKEVQDNYKKNLEKPFSC